MISGELNSSYWQVATGAVASCATGVGAAVAAGTAGARTGTGAVQ